MTDPENPGAASAPGAGTELPHKKTAGNLLRAAREAQGLHIAALATAIKVTPRKVEALENDRLHELPDATFARALAKTICRHLKTDPEPVMALMPPTGTVALEPASRMQSTPYRDRDGRADPGAARTLGPLLWGAVLLLLAAAVVYLLPATWLDWSPGSTVSAPAGTVVAEVPLVVPAASAAPAMDAPASAPARGAEAPGAAASAAGPSASALAGFAPAAATESAPAAADRKVSAETVFAAPPPSAGAAPAVSGALVVSTTEASWVEVRDAKGQLLLSETVQPGRSVGLDGPLPMRLLIGNAAATQLVFMGRAVDVMARSRENVARFELQ